MYKNRISLPYGGGTWAEKDMRWSHAEEHACKKKLIWLPENNPDYWHCKIFTLSNRINRMTPAQSFEPNFQ